METDEIIIVMPARGVADRGEQRAREPLSVMGTLPASAGPYNSQDDRSQAPAHVAGAIAVDAPPQAPARHTRLAEPATAQTYLRRAWSWVRSRRLTDIHFIALIASVLSIGFYAWYASRGLTLAYGDAISHMMIARRVLFSRTPGLAQLGTVWLPLHHILMLPFVWINPLYHSGFAGALPSMVGYVVGSVYLFRSCQLLFASKVGGWIAALTFMLNPNVLYLQSTPMSELPLLCAAITAVYYLLRWARYDQASDLVKAATAVAGGTLIRYDGWSLALGAAAIVACIGWKRRGIVGAEARMLLFGILAFAGCAAWFVYNAVVFHDPLAFYNGTYSSLGQQEQLRAVVGQPTNHNLLLSTQVYTQAAIDTVGALLAILALIGLFNFVWRYRFRLEVWPAYLVLVPFAFNVASLYEGTSSLFTNEFKSVGLGGYYNERYGLMMVPAIALFMASWSTWPWGALRRPLLTLCLALIVLFSGFNPALGLPYVLKDPVYSGGEVWGIKAGQWLGAHYKGGNVLFSYVPDVAPMFYSGVPDQDFITDSNGTEFEHALADPQDTVTWIVLSQANGANPSPIWLALHARQDWRHYFVLRATFGTTQIYQRIDDSPQPAAASPPAVARPAMPASFSVAFGTSTQRARHLIAPGPVGM